MLSEKAALIFAADAAELIARRARELRLAESLTRDSLAKRAGITTASLKRFERTGKASLELVLKLAAALGRLDDFQDVLVPADFQSIADLERHAQTGLRKRGSQ